MEDPGGGEKETEKDNCQTCNPFAESAAAKEGENYSRNFFFFRETTRCGHFRTSKKKGFPQRGHFFLHAGSIARAHSLLQPLLDLRTTRERDCCTSSSTTVSPLLLRAGQYIRHCSAHLLPSFREIPSRALAPPPLLFPWTACAFREKRSEEAWR